MHSHLAISIADASDPGEARRVAARLASSVGLDQADSGRVGLVVTEAATNILKHVGHGKLLLRPLGEAATGAGVEVLALDQGRGMADLARCLRDGYSSAGSPGTGLGAISRLADFLDIYSEPARGTALLAHILPRGARTPVEQGPLLAGAVRVAAPGERECGDDWALQQEGTRAVLLVADGLGHGGEAARAAAEALRIFSAESHMTPGDILAAAHGALLATRGAAVSVAELELATGEVRFAGVGNVAGLLAWPGGSRTMVSQNGTLGGSVARIRAYSYPWRPGGALIMYSDGLSSHVSVQPYPGLLARHPSVVAGVLYRDFQRGRDDATVVVAMEKRPAT